MAQVSDLQLPGTADPSPWSSGVRTKQATNSITAAGTANGPLLINGTSQVTFIAGSQINLEPGFTATAVPGSTGTTFHAFIAPVVPPGTDTVIRTGVKSTGSYWGAAGEQIDLLSGNLNYSVPLIQARGRGSAGAAFALSYNSPIWRQSGGTASLLGRDTGFGLGWTLQAGSLLWVLNSYYVFTDSTGAQYKLDQNNSGVWTSRDGTYASYDSGAHWLYFPDGSFWAMTVQSAAGEPDAGTLYPSSIQDTNGNQIQIQYGPAAGNVANTSGRITQITDTRVSYTFTYAYLNNGADLFPHLSGITGSPENYSFTCGYSTLSSPFTGTAFGAATVLQMVTVNTLNIYYTLQYGLGTGELTRASTPAGGSLSWGYGTYTYSGSGLSYREVQTRQMSPSPGVTYSWNITRDNNPTLHASATVSDLGAGTPKVCTFGTAAPFLGLCSSYEERNAAGTALLHKDYTWAQDPAGNVYTGTVASTLDPGTQYAAQSKTVPTLDSYGNTVTSQVYDYGNPISPARTYSFQYLTAAPYAQRDIRNRVTLASVNSITLTTNTYDGSALTDRTGLTVHDASFGTGNLARGNLTRSVSPGAIRNTAYDIGGLAVTTDDGQGHGVTIHVADGTDFSLPGSILPTGSINMRTNFAYNAGWMPASTTGPNGDTGIKTYDSFGRVATSSSFTRITARRIARPPDADFVARFRSARLPGPTARQLSNLTINYSSGSFPHW